MLTQTVTHPCPTTAGPEPQPVRARWTSVLLPLVVGLLLGPLDLLAQHVLPYPFANLANSSAGWALVAFALGWVVGGPAPRSRAWWPGAAGAVMLLVAVESYYLTGVLAQGDDAATMTDAAARMWLAFAVAGGVGFGTAGAWARSGGRWRGPVGTALATGVLLTEAWVRLARVSQTAADARHAAYRQDAVQTALVLLVLAAVATVLTGRSARQRVAGLAIALPVALAGALAASLLGLV